MISSRWVSIIGLVLCFTAGWAQALDAGGTLSFLGAASSGTEVRLVVPGSIAFRRHE
jgi:hypothetical protein